MILIPQIYLKNGNIALPEGQKNSAFPTDPFKCARLLKDGGAEALYSVDLNITTVGQSPNLQVIRKIREDLGIMLYVGGAFKTIQGIESFAGVGIEVAVIGSAAYQQSTLLEESSKKFPGRIGVHIDVRGGRVTIPGYAAVSNKGIFDYADQFINSGVRHIFYSDVSQNGLILEENLASLFAFCKKVTARVICTSNVSSLTDIEKIAKLRAPKLDGLVLSHSLYKGNVDLKSAISMVNDLAMESSEEPTMTEM